MEDLTDSLLQMWDGRVGRSDLIVFVFFREAKPDAMATSDVRFIVSDRFSSNDFFLRRSQNYFQHVIVI